MRGPNVSRPSGAKHAWRAKPIIRRGTFRGRPRRVDQLLKVQHKRKRVFSGIGEIAKDLLRNDFLALDITAKVPNDQHRVISLEWNSAIFFIFMTYLHLDSRTTESGTEFNEFTLYGSQ